MKTTTTLLALLTFGLSACTKEVTTTEETSNTIREESYGKLKDGRDVALFTITNRDGMVAKVTEYGAILVGLEVPDRSGSVADITHGYETIEGWLGNTSYMGATVGRFGNRIAHGKFTLDGVDYTLASSWFESSRACHFCSFLSDSKEKGTRHSFRGSDLTRRSSRSRVHLLGGFEKGGEVGVHFAGGGESFLLSQKEPAASHERQPVLLDCMPTMFISVSRFIPDGVDRS